MQEELSTLRLNLMRLLYLMMFAFLASTKWPLMISHRHWGLMEGVAFVLLAALGGVAALGLRYPVKMLPILIFEFLWKALWLLSIALPLWRAGQIDADTAQTLKDTGFGVIVSLLVMPWGYIFRQYVLAPGDRWMPRKGRSN